ncbi:MAG TPA: DMT family transporter [Cyclobacteriaceae bacterium]|nr:DMT family transporter [Cyclobacteriaceae bacterium]
MFDRNPALKGIILASITAIFWGVLAIALKVAVAIIDPYSIVWIRFLFAFIMLVLWFLYTDRKKLNILVKPPFILVLGTFFLAVNFIGYMQGVKFSGPENAQIIIQLGPILLAAGGVIFFKEKLTFRQFMGFVIAGIGLFLFYGDQYDNSITSKEDYIASVYYLVVAAVSWAIYGIFQKKLVRRWPSQQLNLVIFGFPVLIFIPFTDFPVFTNLGMSTWLLIAFLGISTIVPYGAFSASLKYIEANKAGIIIALNPIITFVVMAILGWMNVKWIAIEKITWYGFVGAGLVIVGAILAILPRQKE